MAVSLPTIEVTTAQRNKLLSVFPGGATEYTDWLKRTLLREVRLRTLRQAQETVDNTVSEQVAEFMADLEPVPILQEEPA